MTYKLEPRVEKICSQIMVVLPEKRKIRYVNGKAAMNAVFDKHYVVSSISIINAEIILMLKEIEIPVIDWIGEEQQGFF